MVIATITDRSFHYQPTSSEREQLLDYARGIPARVVLEVLRSQHALDFGPSLGHIRRPVSIVHGHYDGVRTVEQAKAMTDAFADAELHVVDAGHSPMYEAPVVMAAIVRELACRATSAKPQSSPKQPCAMNWPRREGVVQQLCLSQAPRAALVAVEPAFWCGLRILREDSAAIVRGRIVPRSRRHVNLNVS
jgi:hypothetical protein